MSGRFGRLDREQMGLLESFLRSRGNLKEMERELGISYPTVRGRVDALVRALGFGEDAALPTTPTRRGRRRGCDRDGAAPAGATERRDILERLARREIGAEEAAAALREPGRRLMAIYVRTQEIEHEIGPSGRFALRVTSPEVHLRAVDGARRSVRVKFELRAGSEEEADLLDSSASDSPSASRARRSRWRSHDVATGHRRDRPAGRERGAVDARVSADVPRGAEIAYDGVSADVRVTGFQGSQQYQTLSGDMILDHVAGDLRVRGVSRDVTVRADEPIDLQMNTVSGDVSALAPRFDELRVVTVSGDLELEGELAPAIQHRVETVSGDLSLGVVGGLTLEVRGLSSDVTSRSPTDPRARATAGAM